MNLRKNVVKTGNKWTWSVRDRRMSLAWKEFVLDVKFRLVPEAKFRLVLEAKFRLVLDGKFRLVLEAKSHWSVCRPNTPVWRRD